MYRKIPVVTITLLCLEELEGPRTETYLVLPLVLQSFKAAVWKRIACRRRQRVEELGQRPYCAWHRLLFLSTLRLILLLQQDT